MEFALHSKEWGQMVNNSKFKDREGFGETHKGHIALQDHGYKVWFRNIKIKELD
ncbi:MAG TPA: family 16 glycoside hydrolase [Salegentibacter sp.]|uniref:family 16 glycoside hydrolase n=1 Tax=Salegentibacter sp. TaxID=1903072 RepID=UPI002F92DAE1